MSETVPITVTPEVLFQLQAATPASARKTRPDRATWQHKDSCQGRGCPRQRDPEAHVQLTYVDARYVQGVLDSEVGPGNWQSEFTLGSDGKVACRIGIRVTFDDGPSWVFKGDGAGETDIEGQKGSFSDAFKRAGVAWGIARDLYGEDAAPVGAPAQTLAVAPQAAPVERPPLPPNTQRYQDVGDPAEGFCPAGHGPWTIKAAGTSKAGKSYRAFWKCDGKTPEGGYCSEKPSKAWADAHPIAA